MKLDIKSCAALAAVLLTAGGAWVEMRVAVARLQERLEEADRRLGRIERSLEPELVSARPTR